MKHKKHFAVLASLTCAVVLGGCGDSASAPALTSVPVEPATAAATATEAPRSERGNLIKQIGEPAGLRMAEGSDDWALNFTVTGIEVDAACTTTFGMSPENGHYVVISIEATTAPEPGFSEATYGMVSFDSHMWKAIASNGTTANSVRSHASDNCLQESELLVSTIGAAEKVTGKVVLDVPDSAGTLVYTGLSGSGWEWEYGTK